MLDFIDESLQTKFQKAIQDYCSSYRISVRQSESHIHYELLLYPKDTNIPNQLRKRITRMALRYQKQARITGKKNKLCVSFPRY